MTPVHHENVLLAILITGSVVATLLVWLLIASAVVQRRRLLKARAFLGGRLLTAQDEERAAIARELHDDIVQTLITLTLQAQACDLPAVTAMAARLDQLADHLRGFARSIHPTLLDHVGLDAAMRDLAVTLGDRENMTVDYITGSLFDGAAPPQRLALYRVAQEALGNVARHAGVDRVRMELRQDPTTITLIIEDHGCGFDASRRIAGPGIGIASMRERLGILGGSLRIESAPHKGTRVVAMIPRPGKAS